MINNPIIFVLAGGFGTRLKNLTEPSLKSTFRKTTKKNIVRRTSMTIPFLKAAVNNFIENIHFMLKIQGVYSFSMKIIIFYASVQNESSLPRSVITPTLPRNPVTACLK